MRGLLILCGSQPTCSSSPLPARLWLKCRLFLLYLACSHSAPIGPGEAVVIALGAMVVLGGPQKFLPNLAEGLKKFRSTLKEGDEGAKQEERDPSPPADGPEQRKKD